MLIEDQVALVTGGLHGLGAYAARMLSDEGADVAILDLDGEKAAELAHEVAGYSQQCDLSEQEHCAVGVSSAMARFGQAPRIVLNCSALNLSKPFLSPEGKTSIPLFRQMMEAHTIGTYQIMSYSAQAMMDMPALGSESERGVIVNVVPVTFEDGVAGQSALSASSAAVEALALPVSRELSEYGIRVMTLAVGHFDDEKMQEMSDQARKEIEHQIPFPNRLGREVEFQNALKFIISNTYLNGTTIRLDGAFRSVYAK